MRRQPSFLRPSSTALVLVSLASAAFAGDWELAPSMPAPKATTFAVTWNGAVYVVGGSPWISTDKDGSVYRFADEAWSTVAPLDGIGPAVGQGGGVDALNRIQVFGGTILVSGDVAEPRTYDPVSGPFFTPAGVSSSVPPLNFGLAVDGQGRIYRLGGGCDDCIFNTGICVRYDGTTDSWQEIAFLPYSRSSIASAYDGQGHIWGFGGYTSFGLPRIHDTIKYTVATNTWETKGSLFVPVETSDAKAVLGADGRIYVIGGLAGAFAGVPSTAVYVLDQSGFEPALYAGPPLHLARYDFGVTLGSDDYIYVLGGMTAGGPTETVERLYTGACPQVAGQSASQEVQVGQSVTLTATVTGGASTTYQWKHAGSALADGASAAGSVISGAHTTALTIDGFTAADAGPYTLSATNPCGIATTTDIVLSTPAVWSDLGQAKPGSGGTPHLVGSGPLLVGSANQLDLTDAAPSSAAVMVFGLSQLGLPLYGGTLVPTPQVAVSLVTDGAGATSLPFAWPPGVGAGSTAVFQAWILDAGASLGVAASNGLLGITQ